MFDIKIAVVDARGRIILMSNLCFVAVTLMIPSNLLSNLYFIHLDQLPRLNKSELYRTINFQHSCW